MVVVVVVVVIVVVVVVVVVAVAVAVAVAAVGVVVVVVVVVVGIKRFHSCLRQIQQRMLSCCRPQQNAGEERLKRAPAENKFPKFDVTLKFDFVPCRAIVHCTKSQLPELSKCTTLCE